MNTLQKVGAAVVAAAGGALLGYVSYVIAYTIFIYLLGGNYTFYRLLQVLNALGAVCAAVGIFGGLRGWLANKRP